MFNEFFIDNWIQTVDLWYWKQPLYQQSHNHFPNSKYLHYLILPITGFKLWTSGKGSDCSANWATTTFNFFFQDDKELRLARDRDFLLRMKFIENLTRNFGRKVDQIDPKAGGENNYDKIIDAIFVEIADIYFELLQNGQTLEKIDLDQVDEKLWKLDEFGRKFVEFDEMSKKLSQFQQKFDEIVQIMNGMAKTVKSPKTEL